MSYRARVISKLGETCPQFPSNVIVHLILDFLDISTKSDDYEVFANPPVQLREFDFLYNEKKFSAKFRGWRGNIATIAADHVLTNSVPSTLISSLLEISTQSLVGKNDKTVLDETVRKSSEILPDQIQLDPEFAAMIASEIQELAQTLGHPTKVIARLHKLVIYKEGDFFHTHIDSPHGNAEPMIFTASVQLEVEGYSCGGELVVGEETIPIAEYDNIGIVLFYHDQPHSIKKVKYGHRLSLIFDVVDSGIPNPDFHVNDADAAFSTVLAKGYNNVAILSSYRYLSEGDEIMADQLKGSDKVFSEVALAAGAKEIEICRVYQDDKGHLFREEVLTLRRMDDSFDALHRHREWDPNEEETKQGEEEEEEEDVQQQKKKQKISNDAESTKLQRPRITYDPLPTPYREYELRAVKDEYRLGDTLFLATAAPRHLEFKGNEEANLGNEGFSGNIFSNLAIIAHF